MRAAWVALSWALVSTSVAHAQDSTCETTDEPELRGLVLQSQAAIDRGDVELNAQILGEIESRIPCLNFAPPPRLWADFMMSLAIGNFVAGKDWEMPLTTALAIRPGIDRGVSGAHPIARWEPPADDDSAELPAAPADVLLYVDGLPSETLPSPHGLHLVQRRDGRWWASMIVVGDAVPRSILDTPAEGPSRIIVQGTVGLSYGFRAVGQDKTTLAGEAWDSDFVPPAGVRYPVSGTSRGTVTFYSPIGFAGAATHPIKLNRGVQVDARIAGIYKPKRHWWGTGIGITSVDLWEGEPGGYPAYVAEQTEKGEEVVPLSAISDRTQTACGVYCWRVQLMAYPHLSGGLHGPVHRPWDIYGTIGWRPGFGNFVVGGGLPLKEPDKGPRFRVGTEMVLTTALLQQQDTPANQLRSSTARFSLELTALVGEP